MLTKIKEFLAGKKTYIAGIIGILGAVLAWGTGEMTLVQAGTAIWAACTAMFIKAAVKKTE